MKAILLLIFYIILLIIMFAIPEFGVVVLAGLLLIAGYRKARKIPIIKMKKK